VAVSHTGDDRPGLLRITVEGAENLVMDMHPDDLGSPDGPAPEVRPVPPGQEDRLAGRTRHEVTVGGWVLAVTAEPAARAILRERAGQAASRSGPSGVARLRAQIPGRVVRLWVAVGEDVEAGQRLLAVEAMKMENEVRAPRAGKVISIAVAIGAAVELGDELLRIE
jgi:biotin carboxyl carrier protein